MTFVAFCFFGQRNSSHYLLLSHTQHTHTSQPSQWQVLDERVIDTQDLDTRYKIQDLPFCFWQRNSSHNLLILHTHYTRIDSLNGQ